MLGALMFISKIIMELLPNIHLLGTFIMVYTLVFRRKALIPIYVFVLITGLYSGFATWWIPYLYIWAILWGFAMLLPKRLTDEEQVPGNKRTKVPLQKMKNSYYIMRGWKDGAPTLRTLKRHGIKLPECAKGVYPYDKG